MVMCGKLIFFFVMLLPFQNLVCSKCCYILLEYCLCLLEIIYGLTYIFHVRDIGLLCVSL